MLENITVDVNEIKSICKKSVIDFDHVWKDATSLISFAQICQYCARKKCCSTQTRKT